MALTRAEAAVSFRYFSVIFYSYVYFNVRFVYRSPEKNLEADAVGARGGQIGGHGGGERRQWDNLSKSLDS